MTRPRDASHMKQSAWESLEVGWETAWEKELEEKRFTMKKTASDSGRARSPTNPLHKRPQNRNVSPLRNPPVLHSLSMDNKHRRSMPVTMPSAVGITGQFNTATSTASQGSASPLERETLEDIAKSRADQKVLRTNDTDRASLVGDPEAAQEHSAEKVDEAVGAGGPTAGGARHEDPKISQAASLPEVSMKLSMMSEEVQAYGKLSQELERQRQITRAMTNASMGLFTELGKTASERLAVSSLMSLRQMMHTMNNACHEFASRGSDCSSETDSSDNVLQAICTLKWAARSEHVAMSIFEDGIMEVLTAFENRRRGLHPAFREELRTLQQNLLWTEAAMKRRGSPSELSCGQQPWCQCAFCRQPSESRCVSCLQDVSDLSTSVGCQGHAVSASSSPSPQPDACAASKARSRSCAPDASGLPGMVVADTIKGNSKPGESLPAWITRRSETKDTEGGEPRRMQDPRVLPVEPNWEELVYGLPDTRRLRCRGCILS